MNREQLEEMRPFLMNLHRQVELMLHFTSVKEPEKAPKLLDNMIANVCALQSIAYGTDEMVERLVKVLNHIGIGEVEVQPFNEGDGATVSFNALYKNISTVLALAPVPKEIRGVKKG